MKLFELSTHKCYTKQTILWKNIVFILLQAKCGSKTLFQKDKFYLTKIIEEIGNG